MPTKSVLISVLAAAAMIGGLVYWAVSGDGTSVPIPTEADQDKNANTVASNWQWENFTGANPAGENSKADKLPPTSKVPYDVAEVYRILRSIKLDENGRLVPDETALQALDKGFNDLGPDLSPEAMSGLQELIRKGLPGQAGEEAAQLLANYYQFRLAEIEFNRQLENRLAMSQVGAEAGLNRPTVDASSTADRHKELVQLRRNYLGQEVADKLFAVEDTQARHMLAAIAIQQDANLTAEDKQAKQAALQEQVNDRQIALGKLKPEEAAEEKVRRLREQRASSADIYSTRKSMLGEERALELAATDREEAQWQSNFNGYWQARRRVMQAQLDEAERERQIEILLEQYFSPEERERARVTSSDWQARDSN